MPHATQQLMTVNLAECFDQKQDSNELSKALKKEMKTQRAIKSHVRATSSTTDEHPQVDCNKCNKNSTSTLSKCSRCKVVAYCSRECQAADWTTHKQSCQKQNYILKIDGAHNFLELGKDVLTEPSVYRTLSVPSTATAEQLKTAIQLVFGYTGESSSDFLIWNPAYVKFDYYDWLMTQAKVKAHTVEGNKHTIEVEENTKPTSTLLHVVEQSVQDAYTKPMRWDSRKMAVLRYSDRTPWVLMKDMKVSGFFEEGQKFPQSGCPISKSGGTLLFGCNFGEKWGHKIELIGRAPATKTFSCTDASGAHLIEAVDGPEAFQSLRTGFKMQDKEKTKAMRDAVGKWEALGFTEDDLDDDALTITGVANERMRRKGM